MALIKCMECGKDISDKAEKCPNCGCPVERINQQQKEIPQPEIIKQNYAPQVKCKWSTGKLVIGIISVVLFFLIALQSCAVGAYNSLSGSDEISGSFGIICALLILVSGIIGIATKSSIGKAGSIWCCALYWIMAFFAYIGAGTYLDLKMWGFVSFAFGIFHLLSIMYTTKTMIISSVCAVLYLLFLISNGSSSVEETTVMRAEPEIIKKEQDVISNAEGKKIEASAQTGDKENDQDDNIIDMEFDSCVITYSGSEVLTDYEGNPCLILYYDFTNNGDDAIEAGMATYIKVFQNGVECESAFYIPDEENEAINNFNKQIQKGVTITVAKAFEISSWDDVTVEAKEAFSWSDQKDTMILKLK